ncbi:CDP-diacylglycerol--glycerol-3-phosphate 3-phosphatidyltransferase [Paenibacillus harenae]|nr:CDP-diacylglycerol--glycerol-3-phosphate 3-phosphatidyltransferase [Paenibacillus harenae]
MPMFAHLNEWGMFYASVLFLLTAATDKLDGYIARKYNMVTNLGKLLDPLADKLLISVALIMLVCLHMIPSWMAVIIIGREVIITAIRVSASHKGIALAADKHGKIKMVFQVIGIAAVMINNSPHVFLTNFPIDIALMLIAVLLTIYSGYNYIRNNYERLDLKM